MSNALNDFVVAAGSYFGLPEGRVVEGSTVEITNRDMELVLRIVLTTDDVVGIGKRMEAMAQLEKARQQPKNLEPVMPSREELRAQWDSLPASQRSAFGSFAKFKAAAEQLAALDQHAKGKDGPLELPPHVWVPPQELTAQQKAMAVGEDATTGRYAMDPADLTPEQLKEWGPK